MKSKTKIIVVSSAIILSTTTLWVKEASAFDILSFLSDISSYISGGVGPSNLSDFFKLFLGSMESQMPADGEFSSAAENGLANSYSIRQEIASDYERGGILYQIQEKNLGENAQIEAEDAISTSQSASDDNLQLAQDSQTTDVSQQILQNISMQLGNLGTINNSLMQQNTRARQEQALGTVLNAQLAKQMAENNTLQRRSAIASQNSIIRQSALISLPGNIVINP